MTVRVVSGPRDLRRLDCGKCGSVLEYRPSDVQTAYDELGPECRYIQCPACGKCTAVPDEPTPGDDT